MINLNWHFVRLCIEHQITVVTQAHMVIFWHWKWLFEVLFVSTLYSWSVKPNKHFCLTAELHCQWSAPFHENSCVFCLYFCKTINMEKCIFLQDLPLTLGISLGYMKHENDIRWLWSTHDNEVMGCWPVDSFQPLPGPLS